MNNNDLFLDLYRRLELFLDGKYHYAESPIKEYIHHLEKSMIGEDKIKASTLDFLRVIRNHLVHRNIDQYICVSDQAINFIKREIDIFENPIRAIHLMLPFKSVYSIHLNDQTNEVLKKIYKNSYDVVPILNDNNAVIGIFTLDVLLKDMYINKDNYDYKNSTIAHFEKLIKLDEQIKERYDFISSDEDLDEIMKMFNDKENKKLKMLFVTENGKKYEPLLGIITPHDIIYKK